MYVIPELCLNSTFIRKDIPTKKQLFSQLRQVPKPAYSTEANYTNGYPDRKLSKIEQFDMGAIKFYQEYGSHVSHELAAQNAKPTEPPAGDPAGTDK